VGFIGLGDQGLPIATGIAEAGYALNVWDRNPRAAEALGDIAYVQRESPEQLAASSDIVALCINTDEDVRALVSDRLLGELTAGSILINHGTGTPANAVRLAEICAASAVDALDAPVSGGRPAALARASTTMVGGPEATARLCEPLFRSFSRHVFYLGGPGSGQTAKLFNNTLLMMNQANVADIIDLAVSCNMDAPRLVDVLKVSSANSRALELLHSMVTFETVEHLSAVQLFDMKIFAEAMSEFGVNADFATARAIDGTNALAELLRRIDPQ
jgi:3-hydroxyisobutyrate dehydrogenase-like beta-hydroxyacid dehydrogenase